MIDRWLDYAAQAILLALAVLWAIEGRIELTLLASVALINRFRIIKLEGER